MSAREREYEYVFLVLAGLFIASLVGVVVAQLPLFGIEDFPSEAMAGWVSQVVVGAFLLRYTKFADRKGWVG